MPVNKPLVFLSHIADEKEIAIALKDLIESSFLGMLDVFISSDENSIPMGQKWLDTVSSGLKTCVIEIVLCSPQSIKKPWINFEAGAGWVRDIPVIPLCHSGIEPSKLPMPLNLLQAASANEESNLKSIFIVLAQIIVAKTPNVDFGTFIAKVTEFEARYTFWDACNLAFEQINKFNAEIIPVLKKGVTADMHLTETEIINLQSPMEFLCKNKILSLTRLPQTHMGERGMTHRCMLSPLPELARVVSDGYFKL